jgi:nitroimidazol reductase NimA-like FMN-containing flavoprotein (pyridoxamine 5'-phosphate oxidase superfamily)
MNKQISRKEIMSLIRSHDFGVLATYGGEYPYTSLISLDLTADDRWLIFPTMRQTQKYANILHEARVSILLDNRASIASDGQSAYALTVMGRAFEIEARLVSACTKRFLMRHPNLLDFLSNPQTALITVTPIKIIFVEKFQDVQNFDWT